MNKEQVSAIIREFVFASAAVLVSFDIIGESIVDTVGAGVVALAMLVWGILSKSKMEIVQSLTRKAIQAIAPVLVVTDAITTEQSITISGLALTIVTAWSLQSKKTNQIE